MGVQDWHDVGLGALVGVPTGLISGCLGAIEAGHYVGPGAPIAVLGSLIGGGIGMSIGQMRSDSVTPGDGFATRAEIRGAMSAREMRRSGTKTRPGISRPNRVPVTEFGFTLGRKANGLGRPNLWASMEEVVGAIAPPRSGKTAWLGNVVIDAPGSALVTSTKHDLFKHTAPARDAKGSPIYVFNPQRLGGIASTFRWSPIEGCDHPDIAKMRAGYLIAGSAGAKGVEDRNFWETANSIVLRCLLFAAAKGKRNMFDLLAWASDLADPEPVNILKRAKGVPEGWVRIYEANTTGAPEKARQSLQMALSQVLDFMSSPSVARAVVPQPGEETFDVKRFLDEKGTLYLIAEESKQFSLAPLMLALAGHIFEGAKHFAGRDLDGVLDPPLTLCLDEAALVCPLPLETMTADGGGRGIPILWCVQAPSQLIERYGRSNAATIMNNTAIKLIFGGMTDPKDLRDFAELCGVRKETSRSTHKGAGRASTTEGDREIPVLRPSELRTLRKFHALLIHRTSAPVITKITPVWERRDVRRLAGTIHDLIDSLARKAQVKRKPKAQAPPARPERLGDVLPIDRAKRKTSPATEPAAVQETAEQLKLTEAAGE